jgi:hypothetical protein
MYTRRRLAKGIITDKILLDNQSHKSPSLITNNHVAMRVLNLFPFLAASVFAIPRDFTAIPLNGLQASHPPKCPESFPCYGIVAYMPVVFPDLTFSTGENRDCCPPG